MISIRDGLSDRVTAWRGGGRRPGDGVRTCRTCGAPCRTYAPLCEDHWVSRTSKWSGPRRGPKPEEDRA